MPGMYECCLPQGKPSQLPWRYWNGPQGTLSQLSREIIRQSFSRAACIRGLEGLDAHQWWNVCGQFRICLFSCKKSHPEWSWKETNDHNISIAGSPAVELQRMAWKVRLKREKNENCTAERLLQPEHRRLLPRAEWPPKHKPREARSLHVLVTLGYWHMHRVAAILTLVFT